ncbi:MAG: holo-ACP synthase [Anaerolineae bacterium]
MLAIGVDLVELARIQRLVDRFGDRFLQRVYTAEEQRYCAGKIPQLGARFAAKEAISKALGTGVAGFCWTELEIVVDHQGQPGVRLHGAALERARALNLREFALSLSHSQDYAIAFVVAHGE